MAKRKAIKLPKKPKASAPLSTWENWHKKAAEKKKQKMKILIDKNKKKKLIEKARSVKL